MKKLILCLMAVMTVVFASAGFVACGGDEVSSQPCEHTNVSENIVQATCTTKGQKNKQCLDCTYVFPAEEIPALGHNLGEAVETEATCNSAKVIMQQCDRCSEIIEETIGEALGHDFKVVSETVANCNDPAMTHYTCDRDGCTAQKSETVEGSVALGHHYVHIESKDTASTCTESGEEVWECDNEGCEDSYVNPLPPLDHLPEGEGTVVLATCTDIGYTQMNCSRDGCGEYKINVEPAKGHDMVDGASITASCDTMGYDRKACQRDGCSYEEHNNVVANTAHSFDNSGVCSECDKGAMDSFALICGDTEIYSIEKVGDEYIVYAPSFKYYTYVVMPANVLQALYAQGVHSFDILLGSRTDAVKKALALNVQGNPDQNVNVLANEMKEMSSYTFADENGIFEEAQDGITFGVYYRNDEDRNEATGSLKVSAYAISFRYHIAFDIDNVNSYFNTTLNYTYDETNEVYTFTNVNTNGSNNIVIKQELLEYYYNNDYKTLTIQVSSPAGQHFTKNVTMNAINDFSETTGNTNEHTAVFKEISLEDLVGGDVTLKIYAVDSFGREGLEIFGAQEAMDSIVMKLTFEKEKPPVTAFTSGSGQIANYGEAVALTAADPVYGAGTVTMQYVFNAEPSYTFINFDAKIINEMIANGYTSVQFSVALPSARYIHAMLNGTDLTSVTKEYGGVANVGFDTFALTADGTYNIRFCFGVETEVTVTAKFMKPVTAYTGTESVEVTAANPVYGAGTVTMQYAFNVVDHVYTYISFNSALINEMKANGYTSVQFSVALPSARYINATLNGTGLTSVTKQFGAVANVEFDAFALTENGTYNICFYMADTTDITVTAKFMKPVTAYTGTEDVAVTAGEPVYEENTATMVYTFNVVDHVYTYINFDSALINEMKANGYTSVQFKVALPSARYINATLNGTGLESVTKQYGAVANVEFDAFALTENGTYNIRFYMADITDITVTAVFSK